MQAEQFLQCLKKHSIIASVKDLQGLERALRSPCKVVFVLFGDLLSIAEITARAKQADKTVFIHLDLIEGLASRDICVDFIAKNTKADGILSTKSNLIRRANACGLLAIQRYFLLDSLTFENVTRQYAREAACAIEVLPGVMPKVIARLAQTIRTPIITGGLIADKTDVTDVLSAGACAVSTTNPDIWFL